MIDSSLPEGISVVIPVYNSERTLVELVESIGVVLGGLGKRFEVILVNDDSRDESWKVVSELAARHAWVHGVSLMRNYGQHNALLCGLRHASYATTVTMDDDLQHPPVEIPQLLARLENGFDVVYGIPHALPHSLWRNLMSRGTKRALATAMGVGNIRDISAFRALRTGLRAAFTSYQSPTVVLDVLLSWGTPRFGTVEVRHDPRRVGTSNYTFKKLANQAMLILTGFSTAPLRLASMLGFAFTIFGVVLLAYVVTVRALKGSIPGFPFLASMIAIFGGVQLFALGIIGEYLARMFERLMERPTYVVGHETKRLL